ncbi:MAG: transposase [Desemzia incerta]
MTKYSVEFKLQVVQEYLEGPLGYKLLMKKWIGYTKLDNNYKVLYT